jgi:hypothetical protein
MELLPDGHQAAKSNIFTKLLKNLKFKTKDQDVMIFF